MDNRTTEDSIRTLKKLRDAYQSQLDASVIAELDKAIAILETRDSRDSSTKSGERNLWILRIVGEVLRVITNISDLIR